MMVVTGWKPVVRQQNKSFKIFVNKNLHCFLWFLSFFLFLGGILRASSFQALYLQGIWTNAEQMTWLKGGNEREIVRGSSLVYLCILLKSKHDKLNTRKTYEYIIHKTPPLPSQIHHKHVCAFRNVDLSVISHRMSTISQLQTNLFIYDTIWLYINTDLKNSNTKHVNKSCPLHFIFLLN